MIIPNRILFSYSETSREFGFLRLTFFKRYYPLSKNFEQLGIGKSWISLEEEET